MEFVTVVTLSIALKALLNPNEWTNIHDKHCRWCGVWCSWMSVPLTCVSGGCGPHGYGCCQVMWCVVLVADGAVFIMDVCSTDLCVRWMWSSWVWMLSGDVMCGVGCWWCSVYHGCLFHWPVCPVDVVLMGMDVVRWCGVWCWLLIVQCLSWMSVPLTCVSGGCGLLVTESICPLVPCLSHSQCSSCLQSPRCGWCALGGLNGLGVCMEGGYAGPVQTVGLCTDNSVVSLVMNDTMSGRMTSCQVERRVDSHE